MNRYNLASFLGLLVLVVVLPLYAFWEPERMEQAQADLRQAFVADAAVMYVENCAVCHGAAGEGIGAMPPLDNQGLREAEYDFLYKTIARGRYDTSMAGWHVDEGGLYNEYQIDQLVALVRYGDWSQVGELAASQGMIPPTLPAPEVDEVFLEQVEALDPQGEMWAEGISLYAQNCTICHGVNGEGSDLGVALNTEAVRGLETAVIERTIAEGVAGTTMVAWKEIFAPEEIAALTAFLQHWDVIAAGGLALTPPEPVRVNLENPEEMLALGERIFTTTCASCHGENGSGGAGPALNSQQVLTAKTDQQIYDAIVNGGKRPNSVMPAFGDRMTSVELTALVSYIRAWEPTAPVVTNPRGTAQGGGPPWLNATPDATGATGGPPAGAGPAWRDQGAPPGQQGTTQPQPGPTIALAGSVAAIADNLLTIQTDDGRTVEAMLGPPWFWSESGIPLNLGDRVELEGFESAGHMEVNWIANLTTGQRIDLRTAEGTPVWSGGGNNNP